MARNQASAARRQREMRRQRKRREKLADRLARHQEKAKNPNVQVEDPMDDPTVDWGEAVRETKLEPDDPDAEPGDA